MLPVNLSTSQLFNEVWYKNNSRFLFGLHFLYEGSMKTVIGIKVSPELKKILQEAAKDENRSLSNFIKHCLLTYLKEKKSIEYKEDWGRYRVMAFHLRAQPTSKEQLALLTWLAGRPVRRGKVKLPGGKKGNWVMARGQQQGRRVLAITWGRPSESGFYFQYVALRTQINAKKDDWKPALLDLARQFRDRW